MNANKIKDTELLKLITNEMRCTGTEGAKQLTKTRIKKWMKSSSLEVQGAIAALLDGEKKHYLRIAPPLTTAEIHKFVLGYYSLCIINNKVEGDWADSRYSAGHALKNWFFILWNGGNDKKEIQEIKDTLKKLYLKNNAEIRECLIAAVFEHLFENENVRLYFSDWKSNKELKYAYEASCKYSNELR